MPDFNFETNLYFTNLCTRIFFQLCEETIYELNSFVRKLWFSKNETKEELIKKVPVFKFE